ncbi:MAG: hypothetical protein ACJ786_03640 [Catenulispora sp.]
MLPFFDLGPVSTGLIPIICVVLGGTPLSGLLDCPDHGPPRLEISATVNQRPATPGPPIRVGDAVVAAVRIRNTGKGDAVDVRLTQTGTLGGAIACPAGGGGIPTLSAGQSVVCLVHATAAAGAHQATVTATGHPADGDDDDDDDDKAVTASTTAGYRGVGGALAASETVAVLPEGAGAVVTMHYSVTNTGNVPMFDLAPSDPLVPGGGIACPGTASGLPAGATVACTAVVRLAPGSYRSSLAIRGDDRTTTVDVDGHDVAAPTVTATAAAGFTVPAGSAPPPSSSPPAPPTTPLPTTAKPSSSAPPPSSRASVPSSNPPPGVPPTPTTVPTTPAPRSPPSPTPASPPATPTPLSPPGAAKPVAQAGRPGVKTPLFLLVMMMPAAAVAAALAARRK